MAQTTVNTPVGFLLVQSTQGALTQLKYIDKPHKSDSSSSKASLLQKTELQLSEYFKGEHRKFELPINPEGTDFQINVWRALQEIPWGEIRTYSQIAKSIGNPKAVQAVGAANAKNPIPIIIPCHRVIGSDGSLVGYSGGIDKKRWLLEHENALIL